MISIRKFTDEDSGSIYDFYTRAYNGNLSRKYEAFKWIQNQNPFYDPQNNYVLIFSEEKLAGYWGVMPIKLYYLGAPFFALFSQETLIDPFYRRQGLATKLLQEVNKSHHLLVSLWHNKKILAITKNNGWINIGFFRPLKKIYKLDNLLRIKLRNRFLSKLLSQPSNFLIKMKRGNKPASKSFKINQIRKCGKEFDDFFFRVAPKLGIISDRTSATLNWKYLDIPHKNYIFLEARKGNEIFGYTVLRIDNQGHNIKKGIIVDLLADPNEIQALVSMIQYCDGIFIKNNVDFATCQASLDIFRNVIKKQGFYEARLNYTSSLWIYNQKNSPNEEAIIAIKNWYFTYGESDGDMW
jgi:ribosomal protein S18 acetylase RimI-like enzyme